jgi:transcriptional regulator with XRE-family HTH domain
MTAQTALAAFLVQRRRELGMTRQQVSEASGVPYYTLSRMETVTTARYNDRAIVCIAGALRTPVEKMRALGSEPADLPSFLSRGLEWSAAKIELAATLKRMWNGLTVLECQDLVAHLRNIDDRTGGAKASPRVGDE